MDQRRPKQVYNRLTLLLISFISIECQCSYLLAGLVSGTVVDATGHYFPGAKVEVGPRRGIHKTDKEGKFSIRVPPVDNVTLTVRDLKTRAVVFRSEPFNVGEGEIIKKNIKTRYKQGSWSNPGYTLYLKDGQEIDNIDFELNQAVPENSPYR